MWVATLLLLSSSLGCQALAAEDETAVLLEVLAEPSAEASRARALEALCDPSREIGSADLGVLLHPERSEISQIDGARLAQCRADPDLAGQVLESLLLSYAESLYSNPDVGERLRRTLLAHPPERLRELGEAIDFSRVIGAVGVRLHEDWLAPLSGGLGGPSDSSLGEERSAQAHAACNRWLEDLAALGPSAIPALDPNGARAASVLIDELRALHLAAVIDRAGGEELAVAVEAARQLDLPGAEPWAALRDRLSAQPDPELVAVLEQHGGERPPGRIEAPRGPSERAPAISASNSDWVVRSPSGGCRRGPALCLLMLLLCTTCWVGATRRWPKRRRGLFRLGAVALAPALLVLLELALTLAGVRPLVEQRPSFNLGSAVGPGFVLKGATIEGLEHGVMEGGAARATRFRAAPEPDSWRIFTLGESSVYGADYLSEEAFTAVLERRLRAMHPGRRIEVLNAGVGGTVSDEILQYTQQVLEFDPDLLVLYLGHNDLHPLAELVERRGYSVGTIALRAALDRLRVAVLLQGLLPESALLWAGRPGERSGFLDERPASSRERRATAGIVEWTATDNLARMAEIARRQGVPAVIGIQGQPDFACAGQPPTDESSSEVLPDVCFEEALRRIALGAGRRSGAPVVDAAAAIREHRRSAGSSARRRTYYWDTIHPTRLGHALIGEALAPEVSRLLTQRSRVAPTPTSLERPPLADTYQSAPMPPD